MMSARQRKRNVRKRFHVAQDGLCFYCRAPMQIEDSTFDHLLPLALGGMDRIDNLILACRSCNSEKSHGLLTPLGRELAAQVHRRYAEVCPGGER
jgi:5-methylcytosine-specific restriction endonuclease McrA